MSCPKCGSAETYRKDPRDWLVICDRCKYTFHKHPIKPVLKSEGYKHCGTPKGRYQVTVWFHPYLKFTYSYSISIAGGVLAGSGLPGHKTLFGCYGSPEKALEAGLEEVKNV